MSITGRIEYHLSVAVVSPSEPGENPVTVLTCTATATDAEQDRFSASVRREAKTVSHEYLRRFARQALLLEFPQLREER